MAIDNEKFRITFIVKKDEANDQLARYIRELKRKSSNITKVKSGRKFLTRGRSVTEKMISDLEKLNGAMSFNRNSTIDRIVRKRGQTIEDNIQSRIEQNFLSSFRLISATNDKRYSVVQNGTNFIAFGIANVDVLDEYTSIFIQVPTDREQKFYEPPGGGYGDIEGWWRLQEYIGSESKDEFASPKTFWWVAQHSHFNAGSGQYYYSWGGQKKNSGGYVPRPFIVKDRHGSGSVLFEEDASELVSILPEISKELLRRAKIDVFGQ